MLIDTHCHLTFPEYQADIAAVIDRALQAGVEKIIVPATDLSSSRAAVELADRFSAVYAAIGVHPQDARNHTTGETARFESLLVHPRVVAVGEIGLDYYRDYGPREQQKRVLLEFMQLAGDNDLPVILHNRAAYEDLMAVVKRPEFRDIKGVFHCFSESVTRAHEVIDLDYAVSFTGTITFKNSSTRSICREVDLTRQFLETDGPFMAPVPYRGKRNEPAYVREIAQMQAEMRDMSVEDVGRVTTEHALCRFPGLAA